MYLKFNKARLILPCFLVMAFVKVAVGVIHEVFDYDAGETDGKSSPDHENRRVRQSLQFSNIRELNLRRGKKNWQSHPYLTN
jgi:hypothetical protein